MGEVSCQGGQDEDNQIRAFPTSTKIDPPQRLTLVPPRSLLLLLPAPPLLLDPSPPVIPLVSLRILSEDFRLRNMEANPEPMEELAERMLLPWVFLVDCLEV